MVLLCVVFETISTSISLYRTRTYLGCKEDFCMSETNKTTIAADWCEKTLPELARFNKAFIKRKGKGFAHVIVLTAENKEDINYCYEKESALFESFGWYCVLMNGDSVPKTCTLVFRTTPNKDEIYNAFDVTGVSRSVIDKDVLAKLVDMIGFDDLTMDYLQGINESYLLYLLSKVSDLGMDRFVNELLVNHYNNTDSDNMTKEDFKILFGTDDVKTLCSTAATCEVKEQDTNSFVSPTSEPTKAEREPASVTGQADEPNKAAAKEPVTHVVEQSVEVPVPRPAQPQPKPNPLPYDERPANEDKINSHSIPHSKGFLSSHGKFRPVTVTNNERSVTTKTAETKQNEPKNELNPTILGAEDRKPAYVPEVEQTVMENQEEREPKSVSEDKDIVSEVEESQTTPEPVISEPKEEESDDDTPSVPAPVKVKKISFQSKEVLTEEDKKQNAELLHKIRSKYEQALQFVTDLHSPQFTLFINLFREALDNNKYTKQWCPMYLEISDDLTTELYAKLYELDQVTAEFNKKLIHQVLHIGCPFCVTEWNEDITFVDKGLHYTRCPNCNSESPFMKEE